MKRRVLLLVLAVAACSTGHVQTRQTAATGALPAPRQVDVFDFAVAPDQVRLDQGVSASFMRAQSGQSMTALQLQTAQATQAALVETLAAKLQSYGLPAVHVLAGSVPPPGTLLVQGQILSVDQGNRTRRTLIGLGAGKSSVSADAQLYYVIDPTHPRFLEAFKGSANSGHMPGAAETMGAGAAADRLATSTAATAATHAGAETRRTGDAANADKLATALARQIAQYAVGQGWLPASAVR